jgi:SAM-dependent methyltransferase
MTWLRSTDLSAVQVGWRPEVAEFDIDVASKSAKFGKYLVGEQASTTILVAKSINKYEFFGDIIRTGDLNTVGSPATHLYVLTKLLSAASGSQKPTFLDAGCGIGFLLPAWMLATGGHGHSVGMEVDAATAASARRHLVSPDAYDANAAGVLKGSPMEVVVADAFSFTDWQNIGLEPGTVDAINVGAAVENHEQLSRLADLLRPGGLLLAPVCNSTPESSEERCDGLLKIFQKEDDGSLQRQAGDPDIPVKFVVARQVTKSQLRR